jgi:hypothetical protein
VLLLIVPALPAQEALRGEVRVDLEPVYGIYVDVNYPPEPDTVRRRALDEALLFFSAMIYGWSFNYDIGEKARGIAEAFELVPQGTIPFGDPRLRATDARVRDMRLYVWMDYRLDERQLRRLEMWKAGTVRSAQAVGYGPLGLSGQGPDAESAPGSSVWIAVKRAVLEDAARSAVRAMLRGSERNRPKEARGYISLAEFPLYYMDGGRWAVSARFRVDIQEIVPFSAY